MDQNDIERKAKELGLSKLAAEHLDEFRKILDNAKALAERLPKDIHWTEEPAHIFNAKAQRESRS